MAPGKSNLTEFPDPLYIDSYVVEDNFKAALVAYTGYKIVRVVGKYIADAALRALDSPSSATCRAKAEEGR